MAQVKFHKFVAALPAELEADAIYYVRAGAGFDIYVTNSSGVVVAYPANYITSIKTVNGVSLLGEGDVVIEGGGGGGGGLTLFEESRNTTSPNATVPVHALTALGAETNIDFVIAPKGTGAIIAQSPDGTTAGGNKRGTGAVDLQTSRGFATRVASGPSSVAMGYNNTASGYCSVAMGNNNTASSPYSVAMGYNSIASSNGSVAMGYNNTAGGTYSVAIGYGNLSSGIYSVAMGDSNTASGTPSVAMGSSNTASGPHSVAMGGSNTASGIYSVAMGSNTSTRGISTCFATGNAGASGLQQMVSYPLRYNTSTDAATQLTVNGTAPSATNTPVMPNNSAYYCRLRVLARNRATDESKSWSGTALIKRGSNAASTTLIGSSLTSDFGDAAMSDCTVTLSADTTLGYLAVTVTGLDSTSVRWVAQLETVEAA